MGTGQCPLGKCPGGGGGGEERQGIELTFCWAILTG